MNTNLHITLGFKIDNNYFGWHEGILYQLPYMNGGRYYGLRVMKQKKLKSGWIYYHLKRRKYGMEKIKAMLQVVDWNINKPIEI
jgi:hypothetical protein